MPTLSDFMVSSIIVVLMSAGPGSVVATPVTVAEFSRYAGRASKRPESLTTRRLGMILVIEWPCTAATIRIAAILDTFMWGPPKTTVVTDLCLGIRLAENGRVLPNSRMT
jgi:hypothetical protein